MAKSNRDMDPKLQRILHAYLKERDAERAIKKGGGYNENEGLIDKAIKMHRKQTLKRSDRYQAKRELRKLY